MKPEIGLSVLVPFRGRDLLRVERFLASLAHQSYQDFEVILLDYGSEPELAARVRRAVEAHEFARYIYNETRGMPWNRAHALNSAARQSRGAYLLCTDIDLIYSQDALRELMVVAAPEKAVYGRFYMLPEGFSQWERLAAGTLRDLPQSHGNTIGAVQLVPRDFFFRLRGLDEFFRIWGVEDYDFQKRLERAGCASLRPSPPPIYHQWHPSAATGGMPTGWIEAMNLHAMTHANDAVRNGEDWGRILTIADRPALRAKSTTDWRFHVLPYWRKRPGNWFHEPGVAAWAKVVFIRDFVGRFAAAESGEVFICETEDSLKIRVWELLSRTVLRRRCPPVGGQRYFRYRTEARDILWYTIVFTPLVADYAVEEQPGRIRTVLVRR
jgi:hypothetical protein